MSATNRGSDYLDLAKYYTPLPLARAMVRLLPFFDRPRLILEPSVGGGAFIDALVGHERSTGTYHRFMAVDIDPTAPGLATVRAEGGWAGVGDFLTIPLPRAPDVVLGNFPYAIPQPSTVCPKCSGSGSGGTKPCARCRASGVCRPPPIPAAEQHVRRALQIVAPDGHVAVLLRLAFLETAERLPFWREHPALHVYVLAQRPSFTDGGTDSSAYAMFLWRAGYCGPTTISVADWKT